MYEVCIFPWVHIICDLPVGIRVLFPVNRSTSGPCELPDLSVQNSLADVAVGPKHTQSHCDREKQLILTNIRGKG